MFSSERRRLYRQLALNGLLIVCLFALFMATRQYLPSPLSVVLLLAMVIASAAALYAFDCLVLLYSTDRRLAVSRAHYQKYLEHRARYGSNTTLARLNVHEQLVAALFDLLESTRCSNLTVRARAFDACHSLAWNALQEVCPTNSRIHCDAVH